MHRLVLTITGGEQAQAWAGVARPFMAHYARRCGADFRDVTGPPPYPGLMDAARWNYAKQDAMREALAEYDRVLWLDADVLVRPDAPDLFAMVPATHWGALDESDVACATPGMQGLVQAEQGHLSAVCILEAAPIPNSYGRYFNCGVQVASKQHSFLYERPSVLEDHGWGEQTRTNARLFGRPDTLIYHLPECMNCMTWYARPHYWRNAFLIHYAGLNGRLERMRLDASRWAALGLVPWAAASGGHDRETPREAAWAAQALDRGVWMKEPAAADWLIYIPHVNRPDRLRRAIDSLSSLASRTVVIDQSDDGVRSDAAGAAAVFRWKGPRRFTSAMNWIQQDAYCRGLRRFLFMHDDAEAAPGGIDLLLEEAARLDREGGRWGVVFSGYDALCLFNPAATQLGGSVG